MIAYVVRTILMDVIFYREVHINVYRFFRESYLRILPSLVIATAASLLINMFIHYEGLAGFIAKSIACVLVYAASVWCIAMNADEKQLFAAPVKRIFIR